MAAAYDDPIGMTFAGDRYAIMAKLGEGGMGAVYRAEDKNLQASVVIKLPHRSMVTDAEFSRRFRDEVRSLVRLSHPHIVKVTDVGEWEGRPFAVLQFLPGGSLEDRLAAWQGPAALAALVSWLGPIGSALDYVHSQKMVHRDVKPGNILFDAQGHPFLGDFGVVKVLAAAADDRSAARPAMTGTGMVLGTPHYMAPELIMGDPFDGRVDQYALAVTAYELLCGRRPFEHEVATRVLMMQTQDAPPSVVRFNPWVSPRLESALLKGLAKAPNDRYPTCAAFAAAVVEASGLEQGEHGRARIRCGSCGKAMTVSVEALAKLSQSGRNAPCPKCQKPLNIAGGTATVLPPNPSGELRSRGSGSGTAVLDVRASTAESPARTPPANPGAPSGGTVVFGGRPVKTVAEPRPELDAGLELVDSEEDQPGRPPLFWATIGLAVACVPLLASAVFLWKSTSGRSGASQPGATAKVVAAGPDSPATTPGEGGARNRVARNLPAIPKRPGATTSAGPQLETGPLATPSPETSGPRLDTPAGARIQPTARVDIPKPGEGANPPGIARTEPRSRQTEARTPQKAEGEVMKGEPDVRLLGKRSSAPDPVPVADDEKPAPRNVPLGQLLTTPEPLAGKLITLEHVYCVGKVAWRLADGSLRVALIESDLELTAGFARVRHRDAYEIGLDRQLADQLIRLGKMSEIADTRPASSDWIMQPANLTVKVADAPGEDKATAGRIVRLELFENFKNEVRGSAKKRLIVLFATQTVTAAGVSTGFGNNDDWQKVPKLGHAYNQFQRFFESNQRLKSQMKWEAFSNQINRVIGEGTRQSAAEQAATQLRLRQMIAPPLP